MHVHICMHDSALIAKNSGHVCSSPSLSVVHVVLAGMFHAN